MPTPKTKSKFGKLIHSGHPAFHFSDSDVRQWIGCPIKDLYKWADTLRLSLKGATDYTWDNCHFFVTNLYGKLALQISIYDHCIALWMEATGVKCDDISGPKFTEQDYQSIKDLLYLSEHDQTPCCQCKSPVDNKDLVHYSFAGGVCKDCYDPKRHLPPDTRGD